MDWNMMTCMDYAAKLCKIRYFTIGKDIDIEVLDYDSDINEPLLEDRVWIIYRKDELSCIRYKESVMRFIEEIGQGAISINVHHNYYLVKTGRIFDGVPEVIKIPC